MTDSRHNKYVSVTDWFKPAPGTSSQGQVTGSTGVTTSGANFVGGSWGSGSGGGGQHITIIKTNDTTPESNSNVYSALRVHNNFIAKDKDERTSGKLSSDTAFEIGEFVSGVSGAILYVDPETLQTTAELDRLKVRVKAYFETLEIVNVNSVGGKQIISPAGAVNCIRVDEHGGTIDTIKERQATDENGNLLYDINGNPIMETYVESVDNGVPEDTYRCYFLAEQDGETIQNRFHIGDQAYSQMFDAQPGVNSNVSSKYYWRLVTGISYDPIEISGKKYHYIDLSISDCDTDSDVPAVGDVICHRGHRTTPDNTDGRDRQNTLEFSAVDTFSPSITLYQGIGESDPDNGKYPYSLAGKDIISYGVNKLNNRAFMNVYGDMYVGDRDNNSYLQFDEVGGLTVKGNIQFGSKSKMEGDDLTLEQRIELASKAYEEDVNQFKAAVEQSFSEVQNQIDGAIETYFLEPEPTLDNAPAVDWNTDEIKAAHVGDLYYSGKGTAYRFQYSTDTGYYWNVIKDTDITLALANAKKAQDTADSKRKIFVKQPSTNDSYEEGDMWANATYPATGTPRYSNDLLRAITAKQPGEAFNIDHWVLSSKYTDDTAAIAAQEAADAAQQAANNAQSDANAAKNRLDSWANDGVISPTEKQGIKEEYVRVLKDKDHINSEYEKYFLGEPSDYNEVYLTYINLLISLFNTDEETVPIPDNFSSAQEQYYQERTTALGVISTAAKKVADDAQAAADNAQKEAEEALIAAEEAKTSVYNLNTTVTGLKDFTDDAFVDGIINGSERKTIENYIYQINTTLAQVRESYNEVSDNTFLVDSVAKTNLVNSYNAFVTATNELISTINSISNQGSVENIDRAGFEVKYNNFNSKYSDYTKYLNAAIKFIEYAINSRVDDTLDALGGYGYLKNALAQDTTITGGLVLTSMVALGYTDENQEYHVMGGINGSHSNNSDIAIWAGGENIDKALEPDNPNAADFLVRMDGTGYAAGGNFSWDSSGKIFADPQSFLVTEDSIGALLTSFQVNFDQETGKPNFLIPQVPFTTITIASDLVLSDSAHVSFGNVYLAYDSTNNSVYVANQDGSPVNFYTTGGISMYGAGDISVTSIMDAISQNLDPNTLTIQNGVLTVIGGTGNEGINEEQLEDYLTTNNYAKKSDIPSLSGYQPLITSSNKLAYSLISGTPTALKNPTALTFGSKTYDGSEAKTIVASDLGALTSHQTIYALTLQAGTFSAGTYTPNSAANTINIPTTTSHISEGANLYFTNARAVNALSSTLANYVTLSGSQTITGAKNFTGGLNVNGAELIYNSEEGYWKLEGNLLVTGGVSMYNSGDSDIPSGGGSIDYPLSWSGFSSGSFDGSAAKTIYIPSKLSELTNDSGYALSSALSGYLPITGGTINGSSKTPLIINSTESIETNLRIQRNGVNKAIFGYKDGVGTWMRNSESYNLVIGEDGVLKYGLNTTLNPILHSGNYTSYALSINGGTITGGYGALEIKQTSTQSSLVKYSNANGTLGYLGLNSAGKPAVYDSNLANGKAIWHEGNFTPSNYLPLSGGTMNAGSSIQWAAQNSKTAYIGQYATDGSLLISIEGTSANNGLVLGGSSGNLLYKGVIVLHATNYAQYALPLTGGGLTGDIYFGNASTSSNTTAQGSRFPSHLYRNVYDTSGNVHDHYYNTGYTASTYTFANLRVKNGSSYKTLRFGGDGTFTWNGNSVIHSGNIGSQSVSAAKQLNYYTASTEVDVNTLYYTDRAVRYIPQISNQSTNIPTFASWQNAILAIPLHSNGVTAQLYFSYGKSLYYRSHYDLDWNEIAYTTSNVASATNATYCANWGTESAYTTWDLATENTVDTWVPVLKTGKMQHRVIPAAYNNAPSTLSVLSATKLTTPRTIWGKSFDGTGNVNGVLTLGTNYITGNSGADILNSQGEWCYLGGGTSEKGFPTYIDGHTIRLRYGTAHTEGVLISSSGNVGIGTIAPAYKLDVAGDIQADGWIRTKGEAGWYSQTYGGGWHMSDSTYLRSWNTKSVFVGNSIYIGTSGGDGKGLALYSTNSPNTYGIHMSKTSTYGTHGSVTQDWAMYFCFNGDTNRGFIFKHAGANVASISGVGNLVLNGNATIGGSLSVSGKATFNGLSTFYANLKTYNSSGGETYIELDRNTKASWQILNSAGDLKFRNNWVDGVKGDYFTAFELSYQTGNAWLKGALTVASTSTFTGKTTHNGGLSSTTGSFSGALTASSTLSVSSTSTFTGNTTNKAIAYFANGTTYYVNASGAAKFASLTSAGAIKGTSGSFSSTLAVTSTSTFTGKTTHNGGIGATSGTFSSTLAVTSTSVLAGGATIGKSSADNGTYKLHVTGSAYISSNLLTGGSITMNSMRSMKNIINEKGLSLEELSTIKPTRFTWKDGRDDRIHVGGIADDVMKVLPEVVFKGSDGVLSMDYASASFVMAASLTKHVSEHERKIANLERENALLKEEIERLKRA